MEEALQIIYIGKKEVQQIVGIAPFSEEQWTHPLPWLHLLLPKDDCILVWLLQTSYITYIFVAKVYIKNEMCNF